MFGDRSEEDEPFPASPPPPVPDAEDKPRQVRVISAAGNGMVYTADDFTSNNQNELEVEDDDGNTIAIYAPGQWRYAYLVGSEVTD